MWCEDTERGSADRIHKGLSDKVIRMSLPAQKAGNQILARRVSSGIAGLDTLLDGGFPEGKVVLVLGEPGTGKTIMVSQFLHNGVTGQGDKGVTQLLW